jgi:hypothetical protein
LGVTLATDLACELSSICSMAFGIATPLGRLRSRAAVNRIVSRPVREIGGSEPPGFEGVGVIERDGGSDEVGVNAAVEEDADLAASFASARKVARECGQQLVRSLIRNTYCSFLISKTSLRSKFMRGAVVVKRLVLAYGRFNKTKATC